jgi:Icc-related predicted phosphoesterase
VPGNHDINKDFPHSQELFEKFYGPAHYFFRFNGSLFVIGFCTEKEQFPHFLDFLEETLKSEAAHSRYRFVFLHDLPVNFSPGKSIKDDPDAGRLLALVERYKVSYVFAGHIHIYHREVVGNCVFLSPGSGGSTIRRKKFDPNYHCVEITISREGVSERLYSIRQTYFVKDKGDYLQYLFQVKYLPRLKEQVRSLLSYLW